MKIGVAETLEKISKMSRRADRLAELQKHKGNAAMLTVLQGAFDPRIEWLLPEGVPPFKRNDLPDLESVLYAEIRKVYLFVKGGNDNLKPLRRESLFIQLLESLAPADADLLCAIKDKKMPYKGIDAKLVKEAFPGLLPDEQK
jgi:Family of unknown function (DUF6433)